MVQASVQGLLGNLHQSVRHELLTRLVIILVGVILFVVAVIDSQILVKLIGFFGGIVWVLAGIFGPMKERGK